MEHIISIKYVPIIIFTLYSWESLSAMGYPSLQHEDSNDQKPLDKPTIRIPLGTFGI